MTTTRPSLPLAPRARVLLAALAVLLGVGAAPVPAGAAVDPAAQRARFAAAWAAQDPDDPLTRITSPLPGI